MATFYADPDGCASPPLAPDDRRVQHALRIIGTAGWQARLQPLALHMGQHRLVRSPGKPGAFVAHLELGLLREALGRFVRTDTDRGYLVVACAVEGAAPAEMGLDHAGVMRELHA